MGNAIFVAAFSAGLGLQVLAGGSDGWRGDGTGRFPTAAAPLHWDKAEQVVWRTPTPKWSNASPVFEKDRTYIRTLEAVICLRP